MKQAESRRSDLSAVLSQKFEAAKFYRAAAEEARAQLTQAKELRATQQLEKIQQADRRRDSLLQARAAKLAAAISHCKRVSARMKAAKQEGCEHMRTANETKAAAIESRRQDTLQRMLEKVSTMSGPRGRSRWLERL